MKSRFYLAFVLAGIVPVVGLAGFYLYTAVNRGSSAKTPPAASAPVNVQQQQSEVQTIASSLFNAIKTTNNDSANLAAHNTSIDLKNFMSTHTGVSGLVIVNAVGESQRTVPPTPALIDNHYGSNPEFQKIVSKFKENGNKNYQFYTNRLGYPAFVFAVPLTKGSFAEVVLNVANFFKGSSPSGQYFILDANSNHYLYHSDASKLTSEFNPQHEAWLNTVQTDLLNGKSGISPNGSSWAAAYGYLGFGKFGVVHVFPLTVSLPAAVNSGSNNLSELIISPMGLGFVLAVALLCIGASVASRVLAAPFRRVVNVILAASEDSATLTPEVVKSFGSHEAGQIVQALALYHEKIQQNKNNEVRGINDQLTGLQRKIQQQQTEAQEKAQQLADKLKELEALKGMTEGLRNQNEQAKTENARIKGELMEAQNAQLELTNLQGKYGQLQILLKAAEAKALTATPAQVSQVRAAAIRTMSEELKNTLGIIKGYVSSVIGAGQGGINEKQQEFLGMVINRSARLEKFINDLVDIYQIEIEQKGAKTEDVNLASEIETFAFNFQTQMELKDLKFKVEAKPGLPKVPVVRRRMTQLWNVLYLQLIKDSPKGSIIPIIVEPVGDSVKVTVQDPGLIVAPGSLPRLFDEFYDPKHPASPQLAGTGLKLALVKTILTAHGGTATAEKSDTGTKLILTFATKVEPAISAGVPPVPVAKLETKAPISTHPSTASVAAKGTAAESSLDAYGIKPPGGPSAGITVGAKPPMPSSGSTAPSTIPPISGLTIGAKPPAGSSTPLTPLPPIAGLTVGAKPPAGDISSTGSLPPLPPIAGLTVGAKPPSAGVPPVMPAPGAAPTPVPTSGILDALISGKIPPVTAPGLRPTPAPAPPSSAPPSIPKPTAPLPPSPAISAPVPKPTGSLDDLLKMKPTPPPAPPAPPKAAPPAHEDDLLE